jgi:gliding motility-associated-like protein
LLPLSAQYDIAVSAIEGCTPLRVKYTFVSTATADTIYNYYWDFSNGQTSTLADPDSVTYDSPGQYTPSLVFNNRADLMIVKPDLITVYRTVPANFIYYDTVDYKTYVFKHVEPLESSTTYTFTWNIETFPARDGPWQLITFPYPDTFNVSLTVTDNHGCTSTTEQNVLVMEELSVQNVFTPNGDNVNDFFMVTSNGGFPLSLKIYTRAGVLVYENEGTTVTWDGRTASGLEMTPGIYFYCLEAREGDPNKRYTKSGVLYLYR